MLNDVLGEASRARTEGYFENKLAEPCSTNMGVSSLLRAFLAWGGLKGPGKLALGFAKDTEPHDQGVFTRKLHQTHADGRLSRTSCIASRDHFPADDFFFRVPFMF